MPGDRRLATEGERAGPSQRRRPVAGRIPRGAGLALAAALLVACAAPAKPSGDILWRIVSECVDTRAPDYCARCPWPQPGACGSSGACARTTEVWAETPEYVAIRDLKMCGCPPGFVHGLALPRTRVTGVEDPARPAGIWDFAWGTARLHIDREEEIALAVNPSRRRTQDQLHVHLVRLAAGARERLAASSPSRVAALAEVWAAAARQAAARGLADYGVLVARGESGSGFLVLAEAGSPEYDFAVATCR